MIALSSYKGKVVGVFGLGKAGRAAVQALLAGGAAEVYAWDDSPYAVKLASEDAALKNAVFKPIDKWTWDIRMAVVVLSPGVPLDHPAPHPVVTMARKAQVKILGEVDLLFEACPEARYIGITGTNGKSTTTALIAHVLTGNGYKVQVGGNLGTPALALEPLGPEGVYVLEMSSYQLALARHVLFHAALLLNITPDHLERHGGMEGYVEAKRNIFERQRDHDLAVIGLDDGYCRDIYINLVRAHRTNLVAVSVTQSAPGGVTVDEAGKLYDRSSPQGHLQFDLQQAAALPGRHNWQNAAMAYITCLRMGLKAAEVYHAICTFSGLPHRLEKVGAAYGVSFINDSKATNAEATIHALEPYRHIYWILGGRMKEGGIDMLEPYFPRIKHAYLIGEAAPHFARTLEGKAPYTQCGDLKNALAQAAAQALSDRIPGAVVLLSPACASFDQWQSFEARGDAFRNFVQDYLQQHAQEGE